MNLVKATRAYIKSLIDNQQNTSNRSAKSLYFGNTKVNFIFLDKKIKNNQELDSYAIRFFVDEKKPLETLEPEDIIPNSIEINGINIITDVDDRKFEFKKLTDCNTLGGNVEPIKSNYIKRRPLMGGASSIYIGGTDATLGILFKDKDDGKIVAVSNNHVYTAEQINAYEVAPELGDRLNILSLSARQPGSPEYNQYGSENYADDYIGQPKKTSLFSFNNYITSDFAAVELYGNSLIDSVSSPNILNFTAIAPFLIASEDEIDSLLLPGSPNYGAPIFKSGRTTGPIGYPGSLTGCSFPCTGTACNSLCATGIFTGLVGYSVGSVGFQDCIIVQSAYRNFVPLRGGDSGSAFFALLSANNISLSAWKFIGLGFASNSPSNNSSAIICRADNFMDKFNLIPWDTEISNLQSTSTVVNLVSNVYFSSETLILSGRKFYQQGRV